MGKGDGIMKDKFEFFIGPGEDEFDDDDELEDEMDEWDELEEFEILSEEEDVEEAEEEGDEPFWPHAVDDGE